MWLGLVRVGFWLLGSLPAHTLGSYGRAVLLGLELRLGVLKWTQERCGLDGLVYCVDRIRSEVKAVAADAIMIMT